MARAPAPGRAHNHAHLYYSLSQVSLNNALLPFTATIGNPVSPCARPTIVGTLGVYISPSVTTGNEGDEKGMPPVWAITCRHVGLPNSLNKDNTCYRHSADDDDAVPLEFSCPRTKSLPLGFVYIAIDHQIES